MFQSKLESYKELQNAGKTLNEDQKTAVAKFNEVIQTLEFARDLSKQFMGKIWFNWLTMFYGFHCLLTLLDKLFINKFNINI